MNKTEIVYQIHQELNKTVTLKNIDVVVDKFFDVTNRRYKLALYASTTALRRLSQKTPLYPQGDVCPSFSP